MESGTRYIFPQMRGALSFAEGSFFEKLPLALRRITSLLEVVFHTFSYSVAIYIREYILFITVEGRRRNRIDDWFASQFV